MSDSRLGRSSTADWRRTFVVLLLYVCLTIAMTYPAVLFLRTKVLGGPADNFQFLWELWYVAHSIFDLHKSPFFDPDVFVPFGFSLIRNQDLSPGTVLLFAPLTHFFGEVFTYNFLVLVSFPLTAIGGYLLARELWSNQAAAILAGIVIGFCPYRFQHGGGHLSIVSTQWIPFFFLYLERLISDPRSKSAVLAGVFFGLCAWTTWYYFFMVPIAAAFYVGVRIDWKASAEKFRSLLRLSVISATVALVFVLPFLIPYYLATHGKVVDYRGPGESQAFAAALADYLIPPTTHFLWGHKAAHLWRSGANGRWQSEWQLYLGGIALLFAVAGVFQRRRRIALALIAMAIGCLIFSFGPGLYFTHPPPLTTETNDVALSSIATPGRLLGQLPGFNNLRAWARLGFFVELAVALLAAGGLASLLDWIKERYPRHAYAPAAVTAVVIGLAIFDFFLRPPGMSPVAARPVDRWLSEQPGIFAFMEFPIPNHAYGGPAIYRTRLTGKRIIMGAAQSPPNLRFWEDLSAFPCPWTLDLLYGWGAKFILVDENRYRAGVSFWNIYQTWGSLESSIKESPRLKEIAVLDGVHVYSLKKLPDHSEPVLFVTPNPVSTAAGKPSRAAISWNTYTNSESRVTLAIGGGPEAIFAEGQSGLKMLDQIEPGKRYQIRLYARPEIAATKMIEVSTVQRTAIITAEPNPVPTGSDLGRTRISWAISTGDDAEVYVSRDGGPEQLFARGATGSIQVSWITAGSSYEFRLYSRDGSRRLLAKTVVNR
jgi:hypothetical protein